MSNGDETGSKPGTDWLGEILEDAANRLDVGRLDPAAVMRDQHWLHKLRSHPCLAGELDWMREHAQILLRPPELERHNNEADFWLTLAALLEGREPWKPRGYGARLPKVEP